MTRMTLEAILNSVLLPERQESPEDSPPGALLLKHPYASVKTGRNGCCGFGVFRGLVRVSGFRRRIY